MVSAGPSILARNMGLTGKIIARAGVDIEACRTRVESCKIDLHDCDF